MSNLIAIPGSTLPVCLDQREKPVRHHFSALHDLAEIPPGSNSTYQHAAFNVGLSPISESNGTSKQIPKSKQSKAAPRTECRLLSHALANLSFRTMAVMTLAALATISIGEQTLVAQETPADQVTIRNKGKNSRTTFHGIINDFSGGKLTITLPRRNSIKTVSEKDVVNVKTPLVEPHINGLKSFTAGQIDDARAFFKAALKDETRPWVHQDILSLLVQCENQARDHVAAMDWFSKLYSLDSKTRHLHFMPLVWANRISSSREQSAARRLISSENSVHRLMGSSVLLLDEKNRLTAQAELSLLSTQSNSPSLAIKWLADMQLWRMRLRKGEIRSGEITVWKHRIQLLPERLKGGPFYLLGKAHLSRQEPDKAAIAFLRIPLVFDDDYRLAAQACFEAAEATAAAGRMTAATTLYREVATRYSKSPAAEMANAILQDQGSGAAKIKTIDE